MEIQKFTGQRVLLLDPENLARLRLAMDRALDGLKERRDNLREDRRSSPNSSYVDRACREAEEDYKLVDALRMAVHEDYG